VRISGWARHGTALQGKLTTAFAKGAATVQRGLNADKRFTAPDG
jgi:hypothetical protein